MFWSGFQMGLGLGILLATVAWLTIDRRFAAAIDQAREAYEEAKRREDRG